MNQDKITSISIVVCIILILIIITFGSYRVHNKAKEVRSQISKEINVSFNSLQYQIDELNKELDDIEDRINRKG